MPTSTGFPIVLMDVTKTQATECCESQRLQARPPSASSRIFLRSHRREPCGRSAERRHALFRGVGRSGARADGSSRARLSRAATSLCRCSTCGRTSSNRRAAERDTKKMEISRSWGRAQRHASVWAYENSSADIDDLDHRARRLLRSERLRERPRTASAALPDAALALGEELRADDRIGEFVDRHEDGATRSSSGHGRPNILLSDLLR